ncbi:hypothetical protein QYF36_001875 [Acer negundo]|nr:hypothetical protein QYF36_001875 [Acer negundo]
MRKKVRERKSEAFVGKRFNGLHGDRDFRHNLVSIFVDNLKPCVNQKGLWGIFRDFGLVRDLYLSPKSRERRSCFAFVRFATREEADRVIRQTNRMHVYGWPIISKVASINWNNKRKFSKGPMRQINHEPKNVTEEVRVVNRDNKVYDSLYGPSYAEILRKSSFEFRKIGSESEERKRVESFKDKERVEYMKWDADSHDGSWLKLCAVGVLKSFADVNAVEMGLRDKKIFSSSYYLGDKNVSMGGVQRNSFALSDPTLINYEWILRWLGIGKGSDYIGYGTFPMTNQIPTENEAAVRRDFKNNCTLAISRKVGSMGNNGKGSSERFKDVGGNSKSLNNKGKSIYAKKLLLQLIAPLIHNGIKNLEKKRVSEVNRSWASEDCDTSSFTESEEGQFLNFLKNVGETSRAGLGQIKGGNIVIDLGNGLNVGNGLGQSENVKALKNQFIDRPNALERNNKVQKINISEAQVFHEKALCP